MENKEHKYNLEYNNTVNGIPSHMPAATQVIRMARDEFGIASENWPNLIFPFGYYADDYYAEMWTDGMDWNCVIWLIEAINYASPKPIPAIMFEKNEEFERLNDYDFKVMLKAICNYRRESLVLKRERKERYNDSLYPYLKKTGKEDKGLLEFEFSHASQELCRVFINPKCLPERVVSGLPGTNDNESGILDYKPTEEEDE